MPNEAADCTGISGLSSSRSTITMFTSCCSTEPLTDSALSALPTPVQTPRSPAGDVHLSTSTARLSKGFSSASSRYPMQTGIGVPHRAQFIPVGMKVG